MIENTTIETMQDDDLTDEALDRMDADKAFSCKCACVCN